MRRVFNSAVISAILCGGCTRTSVISPEAAYSPDHSARLSISCQGSYGAYSLDTKKDLELRMVSLKPGDGTVLFDRRLQIVGSCVDWDARWISAEECVVDIFDYGKGVSRDDSRLSRVVSNHLATLMLRFNKTTGVYDEVK